MKTAQSTKKNPKVILNFKGLGLKGTYSRGW